MIYLVFKWFFNFRSALEVKLVKLIKNYSIFGGRILNFFKLPVSLLKSGAYFIQINSENIYKGFKTYYYICNVWLNTQFDR